MAIPTDDPFIILITIILSIATVLSVLEFVGFLPEFISKRLNRNRAAFTLEILREMGIDAKTVKRRNVSSLFQYFYSKDDLYSGTIRDLRSIKIPKKVNVGSVNSTQSNGFIDLMGATVSSDIAERYAKRLVTFWREKLNSDIDLKNSNFTFIVTPKSGSPFIAYEMSKILNLPLVVHNSRQKFEVEPAEFSAYFDATTQPPKNSVGIIVDDSTTGGAKAMKLIDDLKKFDLKATEFLVIFEPEIKDPRLVLENRGVTLHSIVKFRKNGKIEK
ncbi:phosphoribosyltransferase [Mesorhizobium sp. CA12]|uniref:phosphoribosyltransferase n=1 Tax=Mesorhizobium sp. CA12 TaxID=2876644 RepID=UPI001CCE0166|nr:phosphoribosyltransferase [Mesorhizobium sp. CA12]MBZ9858870.1 phosphoribosyltransferase [Mesorhizobium sp. CA12]